MCANSNGQPVPAAGWLHQQIPPWNAGKLVVIVPEAALWPESEFQRELARLFAEQLHATLEMIPTAAGSNP